MQTLFTESLVWFFFTLPPISIVDDLAYHALRAHRVRARGVKKGMNKDVIYRFNSLKYLVKTFYWPTATRRAKKNLFTFFARLFLARLGNSRSYLLFDMRNNRLKLRMHSE